MTRRQRVTANLLNAAAGLAALLPFLLGLAVGVLVTAALWTAAAAVEGYARGRGR